MSEGRRSPSLLETVNLWLMVVAGETQRRGLLCHGDRGDGQKGDEGELGSRFGRYCGPPFGF